MARKTFNSDRYLHMRHLVSGDKQAFVDELRHKGYKLTGKESIQTITDLILGIYRPVLSEEQKYVIRKMRDTNLNLIKSRFIGYSAVTFHTKDGVAQFVNKNTFNLLLKRGFIEYNEKSSTSLGRMNSIYSLTMLGKHIEL